MGGRCARRPRLGHASVVSVTPSLPLLGVPYTTSTGPGCFPLASVCVSPGAFTLNSVVSSTFNASGQDIVANGTYTGVLTTLGNVPIGPVTLSGTLEEEVLGRTFSTETGSWTTDLLALSFEGPVLGHTLTLSLDGSMTSSGTTSITPLAQAGGGFTIDSFFDVFVDLTLDTPVPLHATRGPIEAGAGVAVPEPASLTIFATALLALAARRRRT